MSFSKVMDPVHLKSVRMLGYVLTDGSSSAWQGLAHWLRLKLDIEARAALAWAALRSLDRDTMALTVEAAYAPEAGAGMPQAPFTDFAEQAEHWAGWAKPEELDAYAVAILKAMHPARRRQFRDFVGREAA